MRDARAEGVVRLPRIRHGLVLALVVLVGGCGVVQDRRGDEQPVIAPVEGDGPGAPTQEEGAGVTERDARHRETGTALSPAAASLLTSARGMLRAGNTERALNLAQRAQRISPDAAEVYYRMAQIYQKDSDHARAEQFALKGISKAGNDPALRQRGWSMLAEIRASRGDRAGAREARERAAQVQD